MFWLSLLKLTEIPYNGDSHKTWGWVHVKDVLSKELGLNLATKWIFTFSIQYTSAIIGLKW